MWNFLPAKNGMVSFPGDTEKVCKMYLINKNDHSHKHLSLSSKIVQILCTERCFFRDLFLLFAQLCKYRICLLEIVFLHLLAVFSYLFLFLHYAFFSVMASTQTCDCRHQFKLTYWRFLVRFCGYSNDKLTLIGKNDITSIVGS